MCIQHYSTHIWAHHCRVYLTGVMPLSSNAVCSLHRLCTCCWKSRKSTVSDQQWYCMKIAHTIGQIFGRLKIWIENWAVSGWANIWSIEIFRFDWWFFRSLFNYKINTINVYLGAAWFWSRFLSIWHVFHVPLISELWCDMQVLRGNKELQQERGERD